MSIGFDETGMINDPTHPHREICAKILTHIREVKFANYGAIAKEMNQSVTDLMAPFVILTNWQDAPLDFYLLFDNGEVKFTVVKDAISTALDDAEVTDPKTGRIYSANSSQLYPGLCVTGLFD